MRRKLFCDQQRGVNLWLFSRLTKPDVDKSVKHDRKLDVRVGCCVFRNNCLLLNDIMHLSMSTRGGGGAGGWA